MDWLEFVSNPRAITHLYDAVPALNQLEISRLVLDGSGPTLTLDMDMPRFADHRPERWEKACNTVAIKLDFFGVENLQIIGFPPIPVLDFHVRREDKRITILATGNGSRLEFTCLEISIQKTSGYVKGAP